MSYVIAVAGAGGKSFYIDRFADICASRGQLVCITTTTHIYNTPDRKNIFHRGKLECHKLAYPGDEEYKAICRDFDVVLVEADGSRHFPVKIPADYEPVIPANANEILVVMGHHTAGRKLKEVCQRFETCGKSLNMPADIKTNSEIIDLIANKYYIEPLRKKFPDISVKYFRNNILNSIKNYYGKKIALVLLCSGSSKRFGNNKLMFSLNGKKLFSYGLNSLIEAKNLLALNKIRSQVFITGGNEFLESHIKNFYDTVKIIENPFRYEGISSSVKCSTFMAMKNNFDAVLFLAGDMPFFTADDISRMVQEFLCSGKLYGCAYSFHPSNPAVFKSECYNELQKLEGDRGALKLINENPANAYYYVVKEQKLTDIDTPEDAEKFISLR